MQVNRIQSNQNVSFKASLSIANSLSEKGEKIFNELTPFLKDGIIDAHLGKYFVGNKEYLQLELYGDSHFDKAFSMPVKEATVEKFAESYKNLVNEFKKFTDKYYWPGAFDEFYKKNVKQ